MFIILSKEALGYKFSLMGPNRTVQSRQQFIALK